MQRGLKTERKPIFNGLFHSYLLNINTLFWSDPVVLLSRDLKKPFSFLADLQFDYLVEDREQIPVCGCPSLPQIQNVKFQLVGVLVRSIWSALMAPFFSPLTLRAKKEWKVRQASVKAAAFCFQQFFSLPASSYICPDGL
jgi:hypothetical protein